MLVHVGLGEERKQREREEQKGGDTEKCAICQDSLRYKPTRVEEYNPKGPQAFKPTAFAGCSNEHEFHEECLVNEVCHFFDAQTRARKTSAHLVCASKKGM